ncbi:hypothetical protein CIK68_07190 [Brachybacterium alimentarium]|nr:hypothetical protein CIK68_07190 [Brachybacterium alimentarium]
MRVVAAGAGRRRLDCADLEPGGGTPLRARSGCPITQGPHRLTPGPAPALTEVDGISLLDALSDENQELPERSVIWTYQGQYAVRQGRYKLVEDAREGMDPPATVERALYDLEADPQESVDISAQAPEVVLALEQELTDYRQAATRWEHEHELEPS